MSSERIEVYESLREDLKATLETQYQLYMAGGNHADAYKTFLQMMELGFIHFNDSRANPKTKMFKIDGYTLKCDQPENWALRDTRRGPGMAFVPKPIFGSFGMTFNMIEGIIPHWGKRVEGNYSGDIFIRPQPNKISVRQILNKKNVRDAFDHIEKMCKKNKVNPGDLKPILDEALIGMVTMYKVTVAGNVINGQGDIGYIVYRVTDDGSAYSCFTFIQYDLIASQWIDVDTFQKDISYVANSELLRGLPVNKLIEVIKADNGKSILAEMLKASKAKGEPKD